MENFNIRIFFILVAFCPIIKSQFTTPCLNDNECQCNDNRGQIFCYASVLTSNLTTQSKVFEQLSSNRTFVSLYFNRYELLPENAFSGVIYNVSATRVYYEITSSTRLSRNLFGRIDEKIKLDVTFITPLMLELDSHVFNGTKIQNLQFSDIKTNSTPFYFKLNSLAGSEKIETLKFYRCSTLSGFINDGDLVLQSKIQIDNFIILEPRLSSLTNKTFDSRLLALDRLKVVQITGSELVSIEDGVFSMMDQLVQLDLSSNNLSRFDEAIFAQRDSRLEILDLSSNPIEYISVNAFKTQKNLKILNIRFTKLKQISFNSPVSLESLDLLGTSTLESSFDWKMLILNTQLRTLSLSYLKDKNLVFNQDTDDSLYITTMLNRLELIKLFGYNFTNQDFCKFSSKSLLASEKPIALLQLDNSHSCNCFTVTAYQLYRQLRTNLTYRWIDQTPSCYRRLYNVTTQTPNDVLTSFEDECKIQIDELCVKTIIPSPTTTITTTKIENPQQTTTNKNTSINLPLVIGISISGLVVITLLIAIVLIYRLRLSYTFRRDLYQQQQQQENTVGMNSRF